MYKKAFAAIPSGTMLFRHSFLMVYNNLGVAARISLPYMGLSALAGGIGFFVFGMLLQVDIPLVQFIGVAGVFCVLGGLVLAGSVISITWHRFVLLGEIPERLFADWRGLNYRAYTIHVLKIVFFIIAISWFLAVLITFLTPQATQFLMPVMLGVILTFVFLRFGIGLVAIALGKNDWGPRKSWRASTDYREAIFVLAVFLTLFNLVPELLSAIVSGPWIFRFVFLCVSAIFMWFSMMVGLCALTTLYGYYVEKRTI